MGGAEVKKVRIGSNPEWLLAQAEVIEEHWLYLSAVSWKGNHQRNVRKVLNEKLVKESSISRLRRNTTVSKSRSQKEGAKVLLPLCPTDFTSSMINRLGQIQVDPIRTLD
jgi:hypothetical protein